MAKQSAGVRSGRSQGGATIYDVARAAGVSGMTVSRVVNGNTKVDSAVRERVTAAMVALKYEVNLAARTARIGTLRIGLLFSNPSVAFMSDFLVGAMGQCSQSSVQLILEHCGEGQSQREAIDKLIEQGADGILVPPPLCDEASTLAQLGAMGMPIVAVATARPAPDTSAVRIDDYLGAKTMMHHLFSLGHHDIAFIKGDPDHTPAQLRYQAYVDALATAGLPLRAERVAEGMFTYRSGLSAARQLLEQPTRPSAVFACNDDMAAAVVGVAHGMRLRVPQDLAICGFDDTPIASAVWPELTTIRQPIGEMASAAVELLIEEIRRHHAKLPRLALNRVMPYTLVTRGATLI
jgi:LacI family transcriptional regulator